MMLLPQFKFFEKKKTTPSSKKALACLFSQFRLFIVGQCYKFYNWHTTGISDLYQLPICCKSENLERPLHLDQEQLVFVRPQATRDNSSQNIKWKLWETRTHFAKQRLSQNISWRQVAIQRKRALVKIMPPLSLVVWGPVQAAHGKTSDFTTSKTWSLANGKIMWDSFFLSVL